MEFIILTQSEVLVRCIISRGKKRYTEKPVKITNMPRLGKKKNIRKEKYIVYFLPILV